MQNKGWRHFWPAIFKCCVTSLQHSSFLEETQRLGVQAMKTFVAKMSSCMTSLTSQNFVTSSLDAQKEVAHI